MSALSLITAAVKNFQPTTSVLAGGAASILVCAIGAVLVAVGVAIVTALVPDSVNQQLNGLAQTLQVDVGKLKSFIPQEYYSDDDFPKERNGV
jgi:uncharacterized membrane-anchored protein